MRARVVRRTARFHRPEPGAHGRRSRDTGAAIVEFAIVVPVFMMLLVGLLEFGRAYNIKISLQGAAREGARSLALRESTATAEQAVRTAAPSVTDLTVTPVATCAAGQTTGSATVRVAAPFTFGIPFVPLGSMSLSASASMRCGL